MDMLAIYSSILKYTFSLYIKLDLQEEKYIVYVITSPTCRNILRVVMPLAFMVILYFKMSVWMNDNFVLNKATGNIFLPVRTKQYDFTKI